MSALGAFLVLTLRARLPRLLGLCAFGVLFIAAGATARLATGGEHGHVEVGRLFELGGSTLVSALLLLGWLIGRFPLIAVLVLMSGVFSDDRAAGYARLYAVTPRSQILLYGARVLMLGLLAFLLGATLLPAFDLVVLGSWPDASVFALVAAQVITFGALTALLSVFTRADAWAALFLGVIAIVWDALRRMDFFHDSAPFIRETVSVLLPPQGALLRIEAAFGAMQPVPWDAFLYVVLYGTLALLLGGAALSRREL